MVPARRQGSAGPGGHSPILIPALTAPLHRLKGELEEDKPEVPLPGTM